MVPGALGIDDRQRTLFANSQTIGFGPKDAVLARQQAATGETVLERIPNRQTLFLAAALRLALVRTDEDVAFHLANRETVNLFGEALMIHRIHLSLL